MKKQTSIFALGLALSLVAGAGWTQGQGGGRPGGRPGFGGPGFGGPGGGGITGLLMIPEVQKELKVDEAQKELLDQVSQEMFQKMRQLFQPPAGGQGGRPQGPTEESRKQFAALQADQLKKVGEILDPKQMTRLKQLSVQRSGTRALAQDDVAAQLKLTADQRSRITSTMTAEQEAMRAVFQGFRPADGAPPSEAQRAELMKKMTDARTATDAKLLAVLTEPQKTQFKAMQGAPFKFPEFRFGGFGGGRRPGGQPNN